MAIIEFLIPGVLQRLSHSPWDELSPAGGETPGTCSSVNTVIVDVSWAGVWGEATFPRSVLPLGSSP